MSLFSIIILSILFSSYNFSIASGLKWDEEWSYSQEIIIPFDTESDIAKYQPIDINIEFQNPCWAKDSKQHSIRVVCWSQNKWNELESQIYSLEYEADNVIKSCNLVFLIPDFADGNEEYFIYYDDSEKSVTNYVDHVKIDESYYRFEPISGYSLESNYFKILDDNYLSYGVSYEGQFMGYNICQHVMRMKKGATEALPKNIELFAAFDFKYT